MWREHVEMLHVGINGLRGMELLLEKRRDLLASGYSKEQLELLPGMLILKLEDGQVRWLVFDGQFKMELWKKYK
ncbi:hypothetical protein GGQ84_001367 [Desulfitispora alkaliphila]|uniref:hypothetical protein n=1 Tax=Desulfitispora alkaliphila TaxID=622674 RepID=UPI003D1BE626